MYARDRGKGGGQAHSDLLVRVEPKPRRNNTNIDNRAARPLTPCLGLYDTQKAVVIKQIFEVKLCAALHLKRVTAPASPATGLNDDLNGAPGQLRRARHRLQRPWCAAWPSGSVWALHQYGFRVGNGLVTDMNAIRRDEEMDNLHSAIYVDQWSWEKVITAQDRTRILRRTVQNIVYAISSTLDELKWQFADLNTSLCREVTFGDQPGAGEESVPGPSAGAGERLCRGAPHRLIMRIEQRVKTGRPHDGRAPDYDDWTLNGDLLLWHEPLDGHRDWRVGIRGGPRCPGPAAHRGGPALPQDAAGGRTAPDHWRRHRRRPAAAWQGTRGRGWGLTCGTTRPALGVPLL